MFDFIKTIDFDGKPKYYVISEYLDGMLLSEMIRIGGALAKWEALKITKKVLEALSLLHSNGYVHGEIDPSSILVCDNGNIKIIDFGIAKQIKEYKDEFQKREIKATFIGNVNYVSKLKERDEYWMTDTRSDIYSAGVLLFDLLTGKLPIAGTTYKAIKGHLDQSTPEQELGNSDLQNVLTKATQNKQAERYQTATDFIVDIEKIELSESLNPRI
jgi:serine/threonine-protein kinase